MEIHDYLIVGSGCTGAIAAETLLGKGVAVTMLDVGIDNNAYASVIPDKDFISIRKTESDQYRYFVGDQAEGLSWGGIKTGEHFTPPRKYILEKVNEYIPVLSETFKPMESLSYGGLGNAWGLGCCEFSDAELIATGLNPIEMEKAYNIIGKRIGISALKDDASPYTIGKLAQFYPAATMDSNQQLLYAKYLRGKKRLNGNGFFMGRTALALLTENLDDRKKYDYRDLDFYEDHNDSAFRPRMSIEQLKKKSEIQIHKRCPGFEFFRN
jgi:hypothetical protein